MGLALGVGNGINEFIQTLNDILIEAGKYSTRTIAILLTLQVVIIGYMIVMGKVSSGSDLIWKFFTMAVLVYVASNLRFLSDEVLLFFQKIISLFDPSFAGYLEKFKDPSAVLTELVGNNFTSIWDFISKLEASNSLGWPILGQWLMGFILGFLAFFMVAVIMFAIINYYLAYIHYLIGLIWGTFMYPFTLFKPLSFIGESIIKGLLGQIIKLSMIFFVLCLGCELLKEGMTLPDLANNKGVMLVILERVVVCLLILYLTLAANNIANEIMTGSPAHSGLTFGGAIRGALGAGAAGGWIAMKTGKTSAAVSAPGVHFITGLAAGNSAAKVSGQHGMDRIKTMFGSATRAGGQELLSRLKGVFHGKGSSPVQHTTLRQRYAESKGRAMERIEKARLKESENAYIGSRNLGKKAKRSV